MISIAVDIDEAYGEITMEIEQPHPHVTGGGPVEISERDAEYLNEMLQATFGADVIGRKDDGPSEAERNIYATVLSMKDTWDLCDDDEKYALLSAILAYLGGRYGGDIEGGESFA